MPKKVTKEDMKNAAPISGPDFLDQKGISMEYLTKKLKRELNAKETKVFSGAKGVIYSKNLIAWNTRQKARMDAHKLRGDYPAEQSDLNLKFPNAMALVVEARQEAKKNKRAK